MLEVRRPRKRYNVHRGLFSTDRKTTLCCLEHSLESSIMVKKTASQGSRARGDQVVEVSHHKAVTLHVLTKHAQNGVQHCRSCQQRSDWLFLQEFFQRVASAESYAQLANEQNAKAMHTIKQAGISAQKDRLVIGNLQEQVARIQATCQRSAVEFDRRVEEERMEHRATREALEYEKTRVHESQRQAEHLWGALQTADHLVEVYNVKQPADERKRRFSEFLLSIQRDIAMTKRMAGEHIGTSHERAPFLLREAGEWLQLMAMPKIVEQDQMTVQVPNVESTTVSWVRFCDQIEPSGDRDVVDRPMSTDTSSDVTGHPGFALVRGDWLQSLLESQLRHCCAESPRNVGLGINLAGTDTGKRVKSVPRPDDAGPASSML